MPRVVEHDLVIAERLDLAIEAVHRNAPRNADLVTKAAKGTLKLNFASIQIEAGVKRHLFDKPTSVYAVQYARIMALMQAKGKTEPLALQLAECRRKLKRSEERLAQSQVYNAHLLTLAHQMELDVAQLREEIAMLTSAGSGDTLVGTGRLIGLPAPPQRRIGPGQGRGKRR